GRQIPRPDPGLDPQVQRRDQADAGRDRPGDQRLRPATQKWKGTLAALKDDGTTTAGNWIYTGSYPAAGNLSMRRAGLQDIKANDPTGMGFFPNWAWSWPLNRRVLYNRASADLNGNPWDATRVGIKWDAAQKKWVGDVPDYPATGATA